MDPEDSDAVTQPETIFDVASITKPVVTATIILLMIERKLLQLTDPVSRYIPEFNARDKSSISIFHLLTHTAGLPAWKPLYIHGAAARFPAMINRLPLVQPIGRSVVYSCLGYILLGEIIRRLTGRKLAQVSEELIFRPLQMCDSMFNPSPALHQRIAPTEMGNGHERSIAGPDASDYQNWRTHRLRGEVHDGNSHALEGEGGNAGLFSTVPDLAKFGGMILRNGRAGNNRFMPGYLLEQATRDNTPGLNLPRGLGWQIAGSSPSTGTRLSRKSFGHNGFTGTCFWIDPDRALIVILLTNRAYFGGNGTDLSDSRGIFHDLVIDSCERS